MTGVLPREASQCPSPPTTTTSNPPTDRSVPACTILGAVVSPLHEKHRSAFGPRAPFTARSSHPHEWSSHAHARVKRSRGVPSPADSCTSSASLADARSRRSRRRGGEARRSCYARPTSDPTMTASPIATSSWCPSRQRLTRVNGVHALRGKWWWYDVDTLARGRAGATRASKIMWLTTPPAPSAPMERGLCAPRVARPWLASWPAGVSP